MRWKVKEVPPLDQIEAFSLLLGKKYKFPMTLASILIQRGIYTEEMAAGFFRPDREGLHDPLLMKGMGKAVDRLLQAYKKREHILLIGDYDVDGTTAVTLLTLFLDQWGFKIDYYIPDRYKEGYGISAAAIDYAKQKEASLIISLDCGIKSVDHLSSANALGIDSIICDHHTPGDKLPPALAILNPKQADCTYPYKELTGCGVGLKLIQALYHRLCNLPETEAPKSDNPIEAYCDLVALSIASDIVPITGENRVLAFLGLKKLQENPLPGIKAIMDLTSGKKEWEISDLVFFIGPRINAAGRLGDAKDAVRVLLGISDKLAILAESLQEVNNARKDIDKEMTQEALLMIENDPAFQEKHTTVLFREGWHKGVVGIVASRLIESHYRPTIMLTHTDGKLVGSARSVIDFDLYEALDACSEHLIQFGGHKYAAGLSLLPEKFEAFCTQFDRIASMRLSEDQKEPVLDIDAELHSLDNLDERFIKLLEKMAPFGPGNMSPNFLTRRAKVLHADILKEEHIKLVLSKGNQMVEAIGFGLRPSWQSISGTLIEEKKEIDIVYTPIFNDWNGKRKINLRLKDIRAAAS